MTYGFLLDRSPPRSPAPATDQAARLRTHIICPSGLYRAAGGLNADILSDGTISVGDRLLPDFPAERAH
jgi:hypothetical protein